MTARKMTDKEFEKYFNDGGDLTPHIVESEAKRPNRDDCIRKISINLPKWLIDEIDDDARHLGNTRQGLIGMWLVKCAREERKERESEQVA